MAILETLPNLRNGDALDAQIVLDTVETAIDANTKAQSIVDRANAGEFKGDTGATGLKGDKPAHTWSGTSLSFENPNGTMGAAVNLKGDTGNTGATGAQGLPGVGASVVQVTGQSTVNVMSQKAVTDKATLYRHFLRSITPVAGTATSATVMLEVINNVPTAYTNISQFKQYLPTNGGVFMVSGVVTAPRLIEASYGYIGNSGLEANRVVVNYTVNSVGALSGIFETFTDNVVQIN